MGQSGLGATHHGRISKVGRSHARAMLVEAAWAAAIRRVHMRCRASGKAKNGMTLSQFLRQAGAMAGYFRPQGAGADGLEHAAALPLATLLLIGGSKGG